MIHLANISDIYSSRYVWIWLLSAFKAGFINSAGFLATGKFVSHVTGFGTQVGIAVGHDALFFGAELLIIPISFIMGGVITSSILDRERPDGHTPPYHLVQGLITVLILVVIVLGESFMDVRNGMFDSDENYNLMEFSIISILCLICGLKNALVTWTTHGKIRVTHLTGLSTDIGLHLAETLSLKKESVRFKEKKRVNVIRIATFLCFSSGAFISAFFFPVFGFKVFFIVMSISLLMTILAVADRNTYQKKREKNYLDTQTKSAVV